MSLIDMVPPFFWIALGLVAMATSTAILGFYTFASRKSLLSDAMSHSLLPGACLGYFFTENVDSWWVWTGALLSVWAAVQVFPILLHRLKLRIDVATGWLLSVFFSIGIIGWNLLQQQGKTGLSHIFFGEAATIGPVLAFEMSVLCALVALVSALFHRTWLVEGFDLSFAQTIGIPIRWVRGLQSFLVVLVVVGSIRITGLVLITAWLIFPALMVGMSPQTTGWKIRMGILISASVAMFNLGLSHWIPGFSIGPWWVLTMGILLAMQYLVKAIKKHR
jgi:manganese/zinc/iron transport system permease protein